MVIIALSMVSSGNAETGVNIVELNRGNIQADGTGYFTPADIGIVVDEKIIIDAVEASAFGSQIVITEKTGENSYNIIDQLDHITNGEQVSYEFSEPGTYYITDRYTPTVDRLIITVTEPESETEPELTGELK